MKKLKFYLICLPETIREMYGIYDKDLLTISEYNHLSVDAVKKCILAVSKNQKVSPDIVTQILYDESK